MVSVEQLFYIIEGSDASGSVYLRLRTFLSIILYPPPSGRGVMKRVFIWNKKIIGEKNCKQSKKCPIMSCLRVI